MEDYSNLSALLESSTFLTAMEEGLEGGHCIMQVVGDIKLMRANQTSEITTLGRMITFLRNHAEEWAKKNIPSNYDINEFNDNCKKFASNILCWQILHRVHILTETME